MIHLSHQYEKLRRFSIAKVRLIEFYDKDNDLNDDLNKLFKLVRKFINVNFGNIFRFNNNEIKDLKNKLVPKLNQLKKELNNHKIVLEEKYSKSHEEQNQILKEMNKLSILANYIDYIVDLFNEMEVKINEAVLNNKDNLVQKEKFFIIDTPNTRISKFEKLKTKINPSSKVNPNNRMESYLKERNYSNFRCP